MVSPKFQGLPVSGRQPHLSNGSAANGGGDFGGGGHPARLRLILE